MKSDPRLINLKEQYLASLKRRSISPGEWISIRFTGIFLTVFVLAHLWVLHYVGSGKPTFREVAARLNSPWFVFLDVGLLVLAIAHGLIGILRVIGDLGILSMTAEKILRWVFLAVGGLGGVMGYRILQAFLARAGR